jgi:hypothetical protein
MLDVYRQVAYRVGTNEAIALAHELSAWHDAMVSHQRTLARLGFSQHACADWDECAHGLARDLWTRASDVLGANAFTLTFLRECAGDAEVRRA